MIRHSKKAIATGKLLVKHLELSRNNLNWLPLHRISLGGTRNALDLYKTWINDVTDNWNNIEVGELIQQLAEVGLWDYEENP